MQQQPLSFQAQAMAPLTASTSAAADLPSLRLTTGVAAAGAPVASAPRAVEINSVTHPRDVPLERLPADLRKQLDVGKECDERLKPFSLHSASASCVA